MKQLLCLPLIASFCLVGVESNKLHAASDVKVFGDLRLQNGGNVVFSDGSVQAKATAEGPQGLQGPTGVSGRTILHGAGDPVATGAGGASGDFYLDTTNNVLYGPLTGADWSSTVGVPLVGPAGPAGSQGLTGPTGAAGATGPVGAQGTQGASGPTGITGLPGSTGAQGLQGPAGVDGKTIITGSGAPVSLGVVGSIGDYYYDTATSKIYGPKIGLDWVGIIGVSLVGPQGAAGPQGPIGLQGSPGTNGVQGPQGIQGGTGPQGAIGNSGLKGDTGATGAQGLIGFTGPAGTIGATGANGFDGKTVLNGGVDPTTEGSNGDFYINTSSSTIFGPKVAGVWTVPGVPLVGPQGSAGATGAPGPAGVSGAIGSAGTVGAVGAPGPTGANGVDGKSLWSGTADPLAATGADGDFYINTSSNNIFGPKSSGTWPAGVSLVGPSGSTGPQGPIGLTGSAGPQGIAGATGSQGPTGLTGANGATGSQGPAGANYTVPRAPVLATGQQISYAEGDDGNWKTGVSVTPTTRFTDNLNETVTDNLTGLIWLKNADCYGTRTWADALSLANNLGSPYCGLSDGSVRGQWRLPNRNELLSLVDISKSNSALPTGHPFTYVALNNYWSGSTYLDNISQAWLVNIDDGYPYHFVKTDLYYVWFVRAGR